MNSSLSPLAATKLSITLQPKCISAYLEIKTADTFAVSVGPSNSNKSEVCESLPGHEEQH